MFGEWPRAVFSATGSFMPYNSVICPRGWCKFSCSTYCKMHPRGYLMGVTDRSLQQSVRTRSTSGIFDGFPAPDSLRKGTSFEGLLTLSLSSKRQIQAPSAPLDETNVTSATPGAGRTSDPRALSPITDSTSAERMTAGQSKRSTTVLP